LLKAKVDPTMSMTKRTSWLLAFGLQLMLATAALGQDYFEPFAPADLTPYGGPERPDCGFFFTLDYINWNIGPVQTAVIGDPTLTPIVAHPVQRFDVEYSLLDTSGFEADFTSGQRGEIGMFNENGGGWLFGGFGLKPLNQTIIGSDIDVTFVDTPDGGPNGNLGFLDRFFDFDDRGPPFITGSFGGQFGDTIDDDVNENNVAGRNGVDTNGDGVPDLFAPVDFDDVRRARVVFDELQARQKTRIWTTELMRVHRFEGDRIDPTPGWQFEFGVGARYMEFDEQFNVDGFGGFLGDSKWYTRARNNMVGPQGMLRGTRTWNRVTIAAEGRYFGGFNFQNIRQRGTIASGLDLDDEPPLDIGVSRDAQFANNFNGGFSFNNRRAANEFSSTIELRLMASYRVTNSISVRGGWTGFYVNGLARPADMVIYQFPSPTRPAMGINMERNREDVFVNGYNVGIEWAR